MSTRLHWVLSALLASAGLSLALGSAHGDEALPANPALEQASGSSETGKPAGLPSGLSTTAPESNERQNTTVQMQKDSGAGPAEAESSSVFDRNIPKGQTFRQGAVDSSLNSPERHFNTSDSFAHGLTFGLDFRY